MIEALQRRIDELEFEVAELRRILAPPNIKLPAGLHLTKTQQQMFAALVARPAVTMEAMEMVIYGVLGPQDRTAENIRVQITKMRHKLRPYGMTISKGGTEGWALDDEARRVLKG